MWADATQIANQDVGDIEILAAAQVTDWQHRIEALSEVADPRMNQLRRAVLSILAEPWVRRAAALGWDEIAMLGVHPSAPLVRIDCMGAVVSVARSPYNDVRTQRFVQVTHVDEHRVHLRLPSGATPVMGRFERRDGAVPIWLANCWRRQA